MEPDTRPHMRIGIVGSGIGGASAAYFVRQALGSNAEIVVFEKASHTGGRIQEIEIAGVMVETGASVIHTTNRYLVDFVNTLGLHRRESQRIFGIWNGKTFDVRSSRIEWLTHARILLRYGLTPLYIQGLVKDTAGRLLQIYEMLDRDLCFSSPEEIFRVLGLYHLTQQSGYDLLRAMGVSDLFLLEIVNGVLRTNYGQDARVNAFANLVSLAGAGIAGSLFSVIEGNNQICQRLLEISKAVVRTGSRVREVLRNDSSDNAYYRYTIACDDDGSGDFDAVIIAAPLEVAGIAFHSIELETALPKYAYQVMHVALVWGRLNQAYFGGKAERNIPSIILTREDPAIPFFSIGKVDEPGAFPQQRTYKILSRERVSEGLLAELFVERVQTERIVWQAYPAMRPVQTWIPFTLSEGLYYINAMESAVSTMETELIASRNVVNLLKQEMARKDSQR